MKTIIFIKSGIIFVTVVIDKNYLSLLGDVSYLIEHGTELLSNSFQQGTYLIKEAFNNGSNINIPKFQQAFDISKITIANLSNAISDNIGSWDKIVKNPRPIFCPSSSLQIYNIPFLGVGLGLFTIMYSNGLGYAERTWNGFYGVVNLLHSNLSKFGYTIYNKFKTTYKLLFSKKNYGNFSYTKNNFSWLWNKNYLNSIAENWQKNFTVFASRTENSGSNEGEANVNNNDNVINNNTSVVHNNTRVRSNSAPSVFYNSTRVRSDNASPDTFDNNNGPPIIINSNDAPLHDTNNGRYVLNNNNFTFANNNFESTIQQDLITTRLFNLNGTLINLTLNGIIITLNWNESNILVNYNSLPTNRLINRPVEPDWLFNYYENLSDRYSLDERFQLRINFGTNDVSDNITDVGNIWIITIDDINNNWMGLEYFISLLQLEILTMLKAHLDLIRGRTNVEVFAFNGQMGETWVIVDFNHLLNIYTDFNTQLERKLLILNFLESIMLQMRSRN